MATVPPLLKADCYFKIQSYPMTPFTHIYSRINAAIKGPQSPITSPYIAVRTCLLLYFTSSSTLACNFFSTFVTIIILLFQICNSINFYFGMNGQKL